MSTITEKPSITRSDIKRFDRESQGYIMEIVNEHGCRWRANGASIMLFPPDKDARPFKVSPQRDAQTNRMILVHQFMEAYGLRVEATESDLPAPEEVSEPDPQPVAETPAAVDPGSEAIEEEYEDVSDAIRSAVGILQAALGVEDEALEALMEVDSLRSSLTKATDEVEKKIDEARDLRRALADERRETERLRTKAERLDILLNEAVAERDKAKAKVKVFRDLMKDDDD